MGMTAAVMALESVERLELIVAYELLCACQALDCDPGAAGGVVAAAHAAVRERVTQLVEDRPPADDLALVTPLVRDGSLARLLAD
jgi:histidine ammonia-lyase